MSQKIDLFLIPQPGMAPQFLATVASASSSTSIINKSIPSKIVLEGYTRDEWAMNPSKDAGFQTILLKSVDGRLKLPGFFQHLKDRKKVCYGRFDAANNTKGILVIANNQPPTKDSDDQTRMMCRYALDVDNIPKCPFSKSRPTPPQSRPAPAPKQEMLEQHQSQPPKKKAPPGKMGILGNLLGAQQRTNQHVIQSKQTSATRTSSSSNGSTAAAAAVASNQSAEDNATDGGMMSSQEVIVQFRNKVEQQLLDFDTEDNETEVKIPITLSEHTSLLKIEDKSKITMDVLKYIVYEQAEEINEEWVAYKEPSEFIDEVNIVVYKEGCAPPEVLEDLNKGDLPDEIKGQQRAIQQQRQAQISKMQSKKEQDNLKNAMKSEVDTYQDDFTTLNQNKRDRRTIEEIQRDMQTNENGDNYNDTKRQRT